MEILRLVKRKYECRCVYKKEPEKYKSTDSDNDLY